ncbi:hypothetical protein C8Q79DRAFT_1007519 [Trametes meyenii]|nr:hypothetical protein C8Q79DRAFT_1007519 [Trametes meyenii]
MSSQQTPTSSIDTISMVASVAALSHIQSVINCLALEADRDVRQVLEPVGFGYNPNEWCESVKAVFTNLNKEARRQARHDILGNMENDVLDLLAAFVKFRNDNQQNISAPDQTYISGHIRKFERATQLVREGVESAAAHLLEWNNYFQALDLPAHQVKRFVEPLYSNMSQRGNANTARPLLARLASLHDERLDLSAQATSIASRAYHSLCHTGLAQSSTFDDAIAQLNTIHVRLQDRRTVTLRVLNSFGVYLDSARAIPETLHSPTIGADLSIERLRQCDEEFRLVLNTISQVQEVYEPLAGALRGVVDFLQKKIDAEAAAATSEVGNAPAARISHAAIAVANASYASNSTEDV